MHMYTYTYTHTQSVLQFLKTDFEYKLYDIQKTTTQVAKGSSFMQTSVFLWLNLFSERAKLAANPRQMKFLGTVWTL